MTDYENEIEVLRVMLDYANSNNADMVLLPEQKQALQTAVEWGEAFQKAGSELPERRIINDLNIGTPYGARRNGYNECLDEVKPVFAKQQQRIAELEAEVNTRPQPRQMTVEELAELVSDKLTSDTDFFLMYECNEADALLNVIANAILQVADVTWKEEK